MFVRVSELSSTDTENTSTTIHAETKSVDAVTLKLAEFKLKSSEMHEVNLVRVSGLDKCYRNNNNELSPTNHNAAARLLSEAIALDFSIASGIPFKSTEQSGDIKKEEKKKKLELEETHKHGRMESKGEEKIQGVGTCDLNEVKLAYGPCKDGTWRDITKLALVAFMLATETTKNKMCLYISKTASFNALFTDVNEGVFKQVQLFVANKIMNKLEETRTDDEWVILEHVYVHDTVLRALVGCTPINLSLLRKMSETKVDSSSSSSSSVNGGDGDGSVASHNSKTSESKDTPITPSVYPLSGDLPLSPSSSSSSSSSSNSPSSSKCPPSTTVDIKELPDFITVPCTEERKLKSKRPTAKEISEEADLLPEMEIHETRYKVGKRQLDTGQTELHIECPHCGTRQIVLLTDLNCKVFRCIDGLRNKQVYNPHMPKAEHMRIVDANLIFSGCGRPFTCDGTHVWKCAYR